MARHATLVVVALAFLPWPTTSSRADELTVTEWGLGCYASNPSISEDAGVYFDVVESPFVGQHSVSLVSSPDTISAAQYLIEYFSNSGSFEISFQEEAHAIGPADIFTWAMGGITVVVSQPLSVHVEGSWSYSLPRDYMTADFGVGIFAIEDPGPYLFDQGGGAETLPGQPASGVITVEGDAVLLPGWTWMLGYNANLYADRWTEPYYASGEGYVSFQITPEPSTAGLLLGAALTGAWDVRRRPPAWARVRVRG